MSCVLRAIGESFDVDAFLRDSPFDDDPTRRQAIAVVRNGERLVHVLLHQKNCYNRFVQAAPDIEVVLNDERRQAEWRTPGRGC